MNREMKRMSKKESKKAMKVMEAEVQKILKTFDYTNYKIQLRIDPLSKKIFIPKPVFALAMVDSDVCAWMDAQIDKLPYYTRVVV